MPRNSENQGFEQIKGKQLHFYWSWNAFIFWSLKSYSVGFLNTLLFASQQLLKIKESIVEP